MQVEQAILGHLQYLGRVEDFVEGRVAEVNPTPPTDCLLGRWLAEQDGRGDLADLREAHERFHALAEAAVRAKKEGKEEEARASLREMYPLFGHIEDILLRVA